MSTYLKQSSKDFPPLAEGQRWRCIVICNYPKQMTTISYDFTLTQKSEKFMGHAWNIKDVTNNFGWSYALESWWAHVDDDDCSHRMIFLCSNGHS